MTPAGWRLVPVEPTKGMTDAGSSCGGVPIHPAAWAAMLAAAPDPLMNGELVDCAAIEVALARHQNGTIHDQARAVLALFRGDRA